MAAYQPPRLEKEKFLLWNKWTKFESIYIYLTYFDSKIEKIQKKERQKKSVYERW